MSSLFFFFFCLKICGSASAPDNASVQGVRAGSKLCGFSRTGARRARRARTTRCSRYRGHAPTDLKQKRDCSHSTSQRTADAFPVVASLPLKIAIFRRERSDDRKCVCCSQATILQSYLPFRRNLFGQILSNGVSIFQEEFLGALGSEEVR